MVRLRRLFKSPFGPIYDEAGMSQSLRRGLMFLIMGNVCGNIFGNITTGSALTGYAGELGASDFVFGVLMAIPLMGTLMQLPAAMIVSRAGKRKKFMLTYGVASRAVWIAVGLVPYFMPVSPEWLRLWSVIFLVGISSVSGSFINVCFTPWLADLVPLRIRGRWISCRDRIISIISVAAGLLTAMLLDYVPGYPGYAIVFVFGGVVGIMDMLAFIKLEETPMASGTGKKLVPIVKQVFSDKRFFNFMMFWMAWCFAVNLGGPFIMRYALGPMSLTFLQVTLASQVAGAFVVVIVISKWGRQIDRYGSQPVLLIGSLMTALAPLIMLFAAPRSIFAYLLFNLVGPAFWSASNLAATNMQLSMSSAEQRPMYIAIFSCVASIGGSFFGVLLGGAILEWLPVFFAWANMTAAGRAPDHYKVIFVITVIARTLAVLLIVPRLENDQDAGIKDMSRDAIEWVRDHRYFYRHLRIRIRR